MDVLLTIFIGLVAIINPFAVVPTWLTLTHSLDPIERESQLKKTIANAIMLFIGFVVFGKFILAFFGLSITAVKLAGALMIVTAALKLEVSKPIRGGKLARKAEANNRTDVSFSPMAMPLLIGPGAIAVIISYLEQYSDDYAWAIFSLLLSGLVILGITYVLLSQSDRVMKKIGYGGVTALSRINGFILLCVGMQFLVAAIKDIFQ